MGWWWQRRKPCWQKQGLDCAPPPSDPLTVTLRPRREPFRVGSPKARPRICAIAVRDRWHWTRRGTEGFLGPAFPARGSCNESLGA